MAKPIDVLLIESHPPDADALIRLLHEDARPVRGRTVMTGMDFDRALALLPDVILAEIVAGDFGARHALERLRVLGLDVPLIVVTQRPEAEALECLTLGAVDYLLKDRTARLAPAVLGALREARLRRERATLESALREGDERFGGLVEMTIRLQALSRQLIEVHEQQRHDLARELHDEIGQSLSAAKINLQTVQRYPDPPALEKRLGENIALLDRLLQQTRNLSIDLRPPLLDDLGLVAALRWYVNRQSKNSGVRIGFSADDDIPRLADPIETASFRVAQESIASALQNASPRQIDVTLRLQSNQLQLLVLDDGNGFSPVELPAATVGGHLGWTGLQERVFLSGGTIECRASRPSGTAIEARFPIAAGLMKHPSLSRPGEAVATL